MSTTLADAMAHWSAVAPVEAAMKAARAAYDAACRHSSARDRQADLSADFKAIGRQATLLRNPAQGQPSYAEELALWEQAEKRWSGFAAKGMAPRTVLPDPMALLRQQKQAVAHMHALASRGVHLSVADDGSIVARPASLLLDFDRQRLRENRTLVVELLRQEEKL